MHRYMHLSYIEIFALVQITSAISVRLSEHTNFEKSSSMPKKRQDVAMHGINKQTEKLYVKFLLRTSFN